MKKAKDSHGPRRAAPLETLPAAAPSAEMFQHLLAGALPLLRPDQVAALTGWSRRMIYLLCETGLGVAEPPPLETHAMPGRSIQRKQITHRSVAALLLRTANYDPADFPTLLKLTLSGMTLAQLGELRAALDSEIARQSPA